MGKMPRMISLDLNRGLALIGIFSVNLYLMLLDIGFSTTQTAMEKHLFMWINLLIKDKFYIIFAILFGIGIAIIVKNCERRGEAVFPILNRRMLVLGILGFIHMQYIWVGDILLLYACCGWILLLLRRLRWPYLLLLAASFHVLHAFIQLIQSEPILQANQALQPLLAWDKPSILLNTLAYFIFGFVLLRDGRLPRLLASPRHLQRGCWTFGSITMLGLAATFAGAKTQTIMALISLPQALFYACCASLFCYYFPRHWLVNRISNYGQLALTHYISQSLLGIFLIAQWMPPQSFLLLAFMLPFAIAAAQVGLSWLWLRSFHYGPMEWLWRWGTYGRKPVLRRK